MKKFLAVFFFFAASLHAQDAHVKWSFDTKKVSDCEYDLIFKANIDEHWHIFSIIKSEDSDGPMPTAFYFTENSAYALVGDMKESAPRKEYDKIFEMNVASHEKEAVFTQRIKLLKTGSIAIKGTYEAQSCDSAQCMFPPADEFIFTVNGSADCATEITASGPAAQSAVDTASGEIVPALPQAPEQKKDITGENISETVYDDTQPVLNWWLIFFQGFIGGFAALLTPCVFPMIPMNVSFFTKQSKTKKQGLRNALLYGIFLIVLYVGLGLGVTLLFGAGALHTMSTGVWFNLAFFALLVIFAVSFLGAFEIVLPSKFVNKMDAKADRGGIMGIFFMAFTLALVSFSCTGPIIGTLLVQASSTGDITGPFWGMLGFSLALALPFGLFAAFPGWLNSLPKSGGWLNSVKVVLGFLELALALKFASNADLVVQAGILTREVFISLWIVIFTLQGAYLLGAFKTAHDSELKHVSVTRLFFAIASFWVAIYLIPGLWGAPCKIFSGILPPMDYSESPHGFGGNGNANSAFVGDPEFAPYMETSKNGIVHFKNNYEKALAYAKKTGKPLMVDFTGHACANCRKTEDYVWPDPEVTKRLNNEVVLVSLYVDDKRALPESEHMKVFWYGKERVITDIGDKFKYMEETRYGQSSQPLYVLLDHDEKLLIPVRGYSSSIEDYIAWLDKGIGVFKTRQNE